MNVSDIRKLYAYSEWANGRMVDAIAKLPGDEFTREIVSSFSSIRDTLSHIAAAEDLWLRRWQGESLREMPEWAKTPSLDTLREQLDRIARERRAYLESIHNATLASAISYTNLAGEPFTMVLSEVLVHCANHSTYHRGQLATMLRQVGATPPTTDYAPFVRETRLSF